MGLYSWVVTLGLSKQLKYEKTLTGHVYFFLKNIQTLSSLCCVLRPRKFVDIKNKGHRGKLQFFQNCNTINTFHLIEFLKINIHRISDSRACRIPWLDYTAATILKIVLLSLNLVNLFIVYYLLYNKYILITILNFRFVVLPLKNNTGHTTAYSSVDPSFKQVYWALKSRIGRFTEFQGK